jgi:hypothetical protein
MVKHQVRSAEQALAYITDCNLATVSHMAMCKSRKKVNMNDKSASHNTLWIGC